MFSYWFFLINFSLTFSQALVFYCFVPLASPEGTDNPCPADPPSFPMLNNTCFGKLLLLIHMVVFCDGWPGPRAINSLSPLCCNCCCEELIRRIIIGDWRATLCCHPDGTRIAQRRKSQRQVGAFPVRTQKPKVRLTMQVRDVTEGELKL